MDKDTDAALLKEPISGKSLTKVLKDSELVKVMVKESADELASVNEILSEELIDNEHPSEIEDALKKSEAIEIKVQQASDKLAIVNQALQLEVKERQLLELRIASVVEQQEEIRHASMHDALTGLPTRALFYDRLKHGLAQARRHGMALAVMFMDLDNFKIINDTHGHDAGDAVLRTIAERLKGNTRGDDTVSRQGGDEFLYLLLKMKGDQDAALVAQKIINVVQAPCEFNSEKLIVRPSIGIAVFPQDGQTADQLIKNADAAMYQAKHSKSGYAFANRKAG